MLAGILDSNQHPHQDRIQEEFAMGKAMEKILRVQQVPSSRFQASCCNKNRGNPRNLGPT